MGPTVALGAADIGLDKPQNPRTLQTSHLTSQENSQRNSHMAAPRTLKPSPEAPKTTHPGRVGSELQGPYILATPVTLTTHRVVVQ